MPDANIVVYPEDWVCRTDEAASFTCKRRGVWRITSATPAPFQPIEDTEWTDYACSQHLVGLLQLFVHYHPVMVDRRRQGQRIDTSS